MCLPAMRENSCRTLPAEIVDVDEEEEEEWAEEEVDVKDLVETSRNVIRDRFGHRKGDPEDDHQLAVQRRHDHA